MYENYCWKWLFGISQSKVATSDRWGEEIRKIFTSNFLGIQTYQQSLKSVDFWQSYSKNKRWTFLVHGVVVGCHAMPTVSALSCGRAAAAASAAGWQTSDASLTANIRVVVRSLSSSYNPPLSCHGGCATPTPSRVTSRDVRSWRKDSRVV